MIVHIKSLSGLEIAKFQLGNFCKIKLKADTSYEMRIYAKRNENTSFVICEQISHQMENYISLISNEAISILGFWRTPDQPSYEPPLPKNAEKLIARLLFKVENNAIYPKIIHWSLREYKKDIFEAKRISLIAKPKTLNQVFFIISTFGALLLADLYQISANYFASESIEAWGLHAGISFGVVFVLFFAVLQVYNSIKIWSEKNHW